MSMPVVSYLLGTLLHHLQFSQTTRHSVHVQLHEVKGENKKWSCMCTTLAPLQVYNLVCFEQELHGKKTAPLPLSPLGKQVYGFIKYYDFMIKPYTCPRLYIPLTLGTHYFRNAPTLGQHRMM
jgi:hypothetical protein